MDLAPKVFILILLKISNNFFLYSHCIFHGFPNMKTHSVVLLHKETLDLIDKHNGLSASDCKGNSSLMWGIHPQHPAAQQFLFELEESDLD